MPAAATLAGASGKLDARPEGARAAAAALTARRRRLRRRRTWGSWHRWGRGSDRVNIAIISARQPAGAGIATTVPRGQLAREVARYPPGAKRPVPTVWRYGTAAGTVPRVRWGRHSWRALFCYADGRPSGTPLSL
eukprot:366250-Chlamydomonas_euryale.AAC.8